ncbi:transcription factor IIIC subunit delta N-term-domain-containing protein [Flammula alnicola]|nr:transcription factor IIIC subunit delta N-term-domain-containing protein [Flammula alnicola]
MQKGFQRQKSAMPIYTTLSIPTVTSYPSLKCLQWSADCQVCFITKSAVVILTPDHGINFDNDSVIKSTPNTDDPVLGWFKTMIQHDQITPMKWPDYSQTWGAASLGSIDLSLTSVAISPTGLSSNGGRCIFATLSSNMDVNLWAAGKNYLKGEWLKIFEVTPYLLNAIAPEQEEKCTAAAVLQAQIISIEWTPQVDFGIEPTPWIDCSLLVLGSRAGHLTFLRYRNGAAHRVASLSVSDQWITHIAFSAWNYGKPGIYEGYLAYGTADGSVGLVKIAQTLQVNEETFSFTPKYDIDVKLEHGEDLIYGPETLAGITALRWIRVPGRTPILVTSNPGLIKLWSAPETAETTYWTGYRSLRIQTQKISTDSSAFHPVSGITYLHKQDKLVMTLFDGSFHVIRHFSTDPAWASRAIFDSDRGRLTSEALSNVSRSTFEMAEKGNVDRTDMSRIYGAMSYDNAACFLWAYESARPSDFSYKHDAKHSSMLVVAQMWESEDDDLLQELEILLNNVKTSSRLSPLHTLRPFLLHLRNPARLDVLHSKLLEILQSKLQTDHSTKVHTHPWEGDLDLETRLKFRIGLTTNLFGWDDLLSLRMKLSLADFAWKLSSTEEHRSECGVVAQSLLNSISHRVLRTIIRYLFSVVISLTANEIPFVSRMIVQSLLPGCPPDLTEEGNRLSALIQPLVDANAPADSVATTGIFSKLNEICPACGVEVPLQDITTAVCENGHTWPRCSVTTFILSTPWVRTCVGCSRKAFLPPSAQKDLPAIARGWVVEELLEAVHKCLFCDNGFVSIL